MKITLSRNAVFNAKNNPTMPLPRTRKSNGFTGWKN